jgi:hypothetical protein
VTHNLTVLLDSVDVLIVPLGFLFLLYAGDDPPRSAACTYKMVRREGEVGPRQARAVQKQLLTSATAGHYL